MSLYYHNVRGLRSKTRDLFLKSQNFSYNVICLTETWLNSSFYDNELFCNKFGIYRKDRHDSHESVIGGGVLIE